MKYNIRLDKQDGPIQAVPVLFEGEIFGEKFFVHPRTGEDSTLYHDDLVVSHYATGFCAWDSEDDCTQDPNEAWEWAVADLNQKGQDTVLDAIDIALWVYGVVNINCELSLFNGEVQIEILGRRKTIGVIRPKWGEIPIYLREDQKKELQEFYGNEDQKEF